jgi:murein DD-endopeptidase MepM/ murein hydrolase activator NlpD
MAPRIRLTALSFLMFAVIVTGISIAASRIRPSDPAALRKQLESIQRKRERTLSNIRIVKQRQKKVKRELREIDQRLVETKTRLTAVSQDVHEARADLAAAVAQYRAAEARLDDHRESVSDRLVAMYELGEVRPVEVLLQATSFTDFANRLYLLNQVVERDVELLDGYEDAQTAADQHRDNVAAEKRRLSDLQSKVRAEKQRVANWREATAEKQAQLMADRAAYERALAELEQNSREVTAMLERLERTRGGRARLAKPWTGSLILPVEGKITSGFGYRTHPIFHVRKMHTGVDIGAKYGTPIHAAGGGVVVFAGRWGGYGNCVIVDHGGGLATLYGHCSSLSVGEGQTVKQGQTIARVGSTGLSTGPHLHFETRRNGRPVNPSGF